MNAAEKRFGEVGRVNGIPLQNTIPAITNIAHAMFIAWVKSPRCRRCHWPHESLAFSGNLCDFCERHVERPTR